MSIIVDFDSKLNYEVENVLRKFFNFFFVPFLNVLPVTSIRFIKDSHKSVEEVVENITTHKALEVLYKKGHHRHTVNFLQKLFHKVWFNMDNSKAVRNRLKIVKRELIKSMQNFQLVGIDISILSIASGSARAVIESIYETKKIKDVKISATFLDKNPEALEYSKRLLKELSLDTYDVNDFSWINGTAGTFLSKTQHLKYNLIEMVGLLDYFDDQKAISIFSSINNILSDGGVFITANICHNNEERFMTKVLKWEMVYRSAEELENLLVQAGFKRDKINLYYEPLKIHVVAVALR